MHKGLILLLFGALQMIAQSEINVSGGSISSGNMTIEWNIAHGLQNLYETGSQIIKLGTLQPIFQKTVSQDSLVIYNLVTANNDGKNDFFLIEGIQRLKSHNLMIYNRLGNIVFQTNDYKNNWNGDQLETGTYFYVFKYNNSELKNSIFLTR